MEKILGSNKDNKKKILVISQYFWPEDFRVNELVKKLSERGYQIDVLTGYPNYPRGNLFPDFKENKTSYYKFHDCKVYRAKHFLRGATKFSLVLNYISFAISAACYSLVINKRNKYDFVLGIQLSPIFSIIPGVILRKFFKIKFYVWVLDIWPDSILTSSLKINKHFKTFLEKICRFIYASSDILFLTSQGFKTRLIDMKVHGPRYEYLPQWVENDYKNGVTNQSIKQEVTKLLSKWNDKKIFLFAGNIGEAQDFTSIISSFKKLKENNDWVFLILGDGRYKNKVIDLIRSNNLEDKIFCLGRYDSKYMSTFYEYSDFLVISLKDLSIFSYTLPGKVQSYMSSGTPIIGMIKGETARIINQAKCGFTVSSGDCEGFANLLNKCLGISKDELVQLGDNGKNFSNKEFDSTMLINRIQKYL